MKDIQGLLTMIIIAINFHQAKATDPVVAARVAAAIAVAQLPAQASSCDCQTTGICICPNGCTCDLTYKQAYRVSVKSMRPLVVFVGQPSRPMRGYVCVSVPSYDADRTQR